MLFLKGDSKRGLSTIDPSTWLLFIADSTFLLEATQILKKLIYGIRSIRSSLAHLNTQEHFLCKIAVELTFDNSIKNLCTTSCQSIWM